MENLMAFLTERFEADLPFSSAEVEQLKTYTDEINVIIRHSADKLTFNKVDLITYIGLLSRFERRNGYIAALQNIQATMDNNSGEDISSEEVEA